MRNGLCDIVHWLLPFYTAGFLTPWLNRLVDCLSIDYSASMYATEQIAIEFAAKVFQVETRVALIS